MLLDLKIVLKSFQAYLNCYFRLNIAMYFYKNKNLLLLR